MTHESWVWVRKNPQITKIKRLRKAVMSLCFSYLLTADSLSLSLFSVKERERVFGRILKRCVGGEESKRLGRVGHGNATVRGDGGNAVCSLGE